MKIGVKTDGTSVRKGIGRRVGCGTFVVVTDRQTAVNCSHKAVG